MSLTKDDLGAIRELMREEIDAKIEPINQWLDRMDGRLDKVDSRLDKMDARFDEMDERLLAIRASQIRVESEWYPKINAALEGISVVGSHSDKIAELETKTEDHDIRLYALERGQ